MAKEYLGNQALTYLVGLIKSDLEKKVDSTDERLTNKREPTSHASTHSTTGSDRIYPSDIGAVATSDIVNTLNSDETNKPLSAAQGKALAGMISNAGNGDMLKSIYDTDDDGKVDSAKHADSATTATNATEAEHAKSADTATSANTATNANHATTADTATNATNAAKATNADEAAHAEEADHADSADSANNATHADEADTATNADNASKLEGHPASYFETAGTASSLISSQKGAENGIAPLDASGMISSEYLPSYVDDVIEGYYYEGEFYADKSHGSKINGETGKIYIDLDTNVSYRFGGTTYTAIVSNDMVEIQNSTILELWNAE